MDVAAGRWASSCSPRVGRYAAPAAGVEAALADPDRVGTVLEHVADVAVVFHLLGSARGKSEGLAEIHGPRLERLLEKLVDTPVRGFVYEAVGTVDPALLEAGAALVATAGGTWRIPYEVVTQAAPDPGRWSEEMTEAALGLLSSGRSS